MNEPNEVPKANDMSDEHAIDTPNGGDLERNPAGPTDGRAHTDTAESAAHAVDAFGSGEEMTPAERAEAKQYGRIDFACELVDKAIDVGFLSLMAFVLAVPVDSFLRTIAPLKANDTLRLAALFLIVMGLHILVSLPLSFYRGYLLEHRFGLSNLTRRGWLWRYTKHMALAVAFGLVMFECLYWLIWTTGPWWWLLAAVAFFLVSVLLGQLAPVLILPLFYKIERIDSEELQQRMTRLSEGTGLAIEGVYRLDLSAETKKANAMLAGVGRTRRVLMGDTLLENFTPEEIEVIFAHEIGHHVHRHIPKLIATGAVLSAAGFWLCNVLLMHGAGSANYSNLSTAKLPLLMLVLTLFSLLLEPLQNVISRRYERQCDRYALTRTGARESYRSAFRKLARLNKDNPEPYWLEVALFHSHPPIAERVAMADE